MRKTIIQIMFMLLCVATRAQSIDTTMVPIYSVSSTGMGYVLDSCITLNCFQKDSGTIGIYLLNVLDTAASVFTISECYVLQGDILHIPESLPLHFVLQYRNSFFMVSGRALLKKGVCQNGEKMKVLIEKSPSNHSTDDTFFPCTIIVNNIGERYYIRKYD